MDAEQGVNGLLIALVIELETFTVVVSPIVR